MNRPNQLHCLTKPPLWRSPCSKKNWCVRLHYWPNVHPQVEESRRKKAEKSNKNKYFLLFQVTSRRVVCFRHSGSTGELLVQSGYSGGYLIYRPPLYWHACVGGWIDVGKEEKRVWSNRLTHSNRLSDYLCVLSSGPCREGAGSVWNPNRAWQLEHMLLMGKSMFDRPFK